MVDPVFFDRGPIPTLFELHPSSVIDLQLRILSIRPLNRVAGY